MKVNAKKVVWIMSQWPVSWVALIIMVVCFFVVKAEQGQNRAIKETGLMLFFMASTIAFGIFYLKLLISLTNRKFKSELKKLLIYAIPFLIVFFGSAYLYGDKGILSVTIGPLVLVFYSLCKRIFC